MTQVELADAIVETLNGKSVADLKAIKTVADARGWMEVSVTAQCLIQRAEGYTMDAAKSAEQDAIIAQLRAEMGL